ncbi:MAG: peptide ABC transporter substrate-binding protein, partial [Chthonomonadales bacterium]
MRASNSLRLIVLILAAATLLAGITGCGPKGSSGGGSGKTENVLRYAIRLDPPSLDPAILQDVYTSELVQNVYEGLTTIDENNKPVPCLAEKWDISPNGMTYTFHLRQGVKFTNGDPFTAEDVKYSLERVLLPETKSPTGPNYLAGVVGVKEMVAGTSKTLSGLKVIDPSTVSITLDKPRAYFLSMIAYPSNFILSKKTLQSAHGPFTKDQAIGTGLFKVEKFDQGSLVVLTANTSYWGGRPKLDRIERPVVINFQTTHAKYEADETDVCETNTTDYKADSQDSRFKTQTQVIPQANTWYIAFHPKLEPKFADVRVRRAFAMAINRDELTRIATNGVYPRADGFLPPGMPGFTTGLNKIPYDPEAAKKLFAEAGFPGGAGFPKLKCVYAQGTIESAAAVQRIRSDLKTNLDVELETQERESGIFFKETGDKELIPFFFTGWVADYIDPQDFLSTMLRTGSALNHVAYSNTKFDALCDEADSTTDMDKRVKLYQQADQICVDDVAFLPIMYGSQPILIKPR